MKRTLLLSTLMLAVIISGCTYKVAHTPDQVRIDGTKVDFSNLDQYKKVEQCYTRRSEGTASIFEAAKKAGITQIVHVDESVKGDTYCAIVYGI